MRTQPRFHRFTRITAVTLLLACVATGVFAQGAGKETSAARKDGPGTTASSFTYDLEIKNGGLIWSGPKRKDNASGVESNLENVVDLLREQHPEANFVVSPSLGGMGIADLKLRTASAEEKLEAIRIAGGSQFLWNDNRRTAVDPATGLPMVENKSAKAMYVLTDLPATAKPGIQVEAFNIGGYLDSLGNKEDKGDREMMINTKMKEIEEMVAETVNQYRKISADLNRSGSASLHLPSIRFHHGANLVIIIGEPETVAVAAKVIGALPSAQRSVASVFPGEYANASRRYDQLLNSVNDFADSMNLNVFSLEYASPADVQVSVQAVLTDKRSKAIADARSNSLLVRATAQELRMAEKLIKQLDVPDRKPGGETSPPPANSRR